MIDKKFYFDSKQPILIVIRGLGKVNNMSEKADWHWRLARTFVSAIVVNHKNCKIAKPNFFSIARTQNCQINRYIARRTMLKKCPSCVKKLLVFLRFLIKLVS